MKSFVHFSIAVVVMALAGCSNHANSGKNEATESSPTSIVHDGSEAAKIYEQKCSNCHGDTLEGKIGPELNSIEDRLSLQQVEDIIQNGAPAMPGDLVAEDEAAKLAEWLVHKQ